MDKLFKKKFTYVIIGIVGTLTIPFFCSASVYEEYQTVPFDLDTTFYWDRSGGAMSDWVEYDINGYPFWQNEGYGFDLLLEDNDVTQYPPLTTYEFWAITNSPLGLSYFTYQSGGYGYVLYCNDVSSAVLTDKIVYIHQCGPMVVSPLNEVSFYTNYLTGQLYGMFYTDDDLSYIDTQIELFAFLDNHADTLTSNLNLNYPTQGETVASTTVDFSVNYINVDNYETVGFRIIQQDNYFETTYLEGTPSEGQSSFNTSTTLGAGSYFYQAYLKGTPTTTVYSDETYSFYVLNNPYDTATTTIINTNFECNDLGTIAGAFCSVLVKLFKPSSENLGRFADLKTALEEKPPFAYFYAIKNQYAELGASTTPAFVLQQVGSITTKVFDPLKSGLGYVLWLLFGIYAIKRIAGARI